MGGLLEEEREGTEKETEKRAERGGGRDWYPGTRVVGEKKEEGRREEERKKERGRDGRWARPTF